MFVLQLMGFVKRIANYFPCYPNATFVWHSPRFVKNSMLPFCGGLSNLWA